MVDKGKGVFEVARTIKMKVEFIKGTCTEKV